MGFNWAFKGLNAELNPISCLLALLGAHHILHVSRIRVNKNTHEVAAKSFWNSLVSFTRIAA
jgi:hypothetical protein